MDLAEYIALLGGDEATAEHYWPALVEEIRSGRRAMTGIPRGWSTPRKITADELLHLKFDRSPEGTSQLRARHRDILDGTYQIRFQNVQVSEEPPRSAAPPAAPVVAKQRRRPGPKPGTIDRVGEADRALFPRMVKLTGPPEYLSSEAAALQLALAGKVAGTGTPANKARRLARKFRAAGRN